MASKTKLASVSGKHSAGTRQANKKTGQKRKKRWAIRIAVIVFSIFLVLAVAVFAWVKVNVKPPDIDPVIRNTETKEPVTDASGNTIETEMTENTDQSTRVDGRKDDFYTVLLAGTDKSGGLADVIMVAAFDVANQKVNVINIPRDTLVNADRTIKKINSSYGYGGVDQLIDEVASVIGFEPDRYAVVNLQGFVKLVDEIGGVEFDVPTNMNYDDPTQDLHIHLSKGLQRLNGSQAIQLVRFRSGYANADLGRIAVTQDFLKATAKQTLKIQNLGKIPQFANIFVEYVKTNLTTGEILWFGQEGMKVDMEENLNFYTLSEELGSYKGISYVVLNETAVLDLVNSTINPYTYDITAGDLDIINRGKETSAPEANSAKPTITYTKTTSTTAPVTTTEAVTESSETSSGSEDTSGQEGDATDVSEAQDPSENNTSGNTEDTSGSESTEPEGFGSIDETGEGTDPAESTEPTEPSETNTQSTQVTTETTGTEASEPTLWTGDVFDPNGY